jgi:hypothetical protein
MRSLPYSRILTIKQEGQELEDYPSFFNHHSKDWCGQESLMDDSSRGSLKMTLASSTFSPQDAHYCKWKKYQLHNKHDGPLSGKGK